MTTARFQSALNVLIDRPNPNPMVNLIIPIAEMMGRNQLKPALDQCGKLLKKQPTFYLLHAIKAHLLHILGRDEDALNVFLNFDSPNHPANSDPDYVHFISFTLLAQGQHQQLVRLFEKATAKVSAESKHVILDAFLTLAEIGRLKDQQQIGLKLLKAFPDDPRYLFWALLPMILQLHNHHNGDPNGQISILVSIAHRCLQTLLDKRGNPACSSNGSAGHGISDLPAAPPLDDPDEFWVVLKVLEMVGQWQPTHGDIGKVVGVAKLKYSPSLFRQECVSHGEATGENRSNHCPSAIEPDKLCVVPHVDHQPPPAQLASSPNSRNAEIPEHVCSARRDYLEMFDTVLGKDMRRKYLGLELMWRERAVDWANTDGLEEFASRMIRNLSDGDRNWHTMISLNKCIVNLLQKAGSGVNLLNTVDQLYMHLNEVDASQKASERGYSLARIDLRCRLREHSLASIGVELSPFSARLDEVLGAYFHQFCGKTCCFDDLAPYLKPLTTEDADELSVKLKQTIEYNALDPSALSEDLLCRQVNREKVCRVIQSFAVGSSASEAVRLLKAYFKFLPLGEDLPETALQPADDFAILAAQVLISEWQNTEVYRGSISALYAATYILEICVAKSVYRYQARSLLIRLYRLLGNAPRSLSHFLELGIKQIQYDTLSHLGLDRCSMFFGVTLPMAMDKDSEDRDPVTVSELIEYPTSIYEFIENDATKWINNSYFRGSYIKIEDLHIFKHQIQFSLQKQILQIERIRLQMFDKISVSVNKPSKKDSPRCFVSFNKRKNESGRSAWDEDVVKLHLLQVLQDCHSAIDNRDFTVIPEHQPRGSSGTSHQTSLGPVVGARWLWTIGITYARIMMPDSTFADHPSLSHPDFFSECSQHEVSLYHFSRNLARLLSCTQSNQLDSHAAALCDFFQSRIEAIKALAYAADADSSPSKEHPPSDLIAVIHSACEGFCLFELAHEQNSGAATKATKNSTLVKVMKTTKARIVAALKALDLAVTELLELVKTDHEMNAANYSTVCIFASQNTSIPELQDWDPEHFGIDSPWTEHMNKIYDEQQKTVLGLHSLLKQLAGQ